MKSSAEFPLTSKALPSEEVAVMVDAVAKVIGLLGYATKTEGIGGLIK